MGACMDDLIHLGGELGVDGGNDRLDRLDRVVESGDAPEAELLALDHLFAELIRERISHGDFKGHNLFWDKDRR